MWILLSAASATNPTYTLSFPDRQAHRLHVSAALSSTGDTTDVVMATWTPGSYLIREYARHVERLHATDSNGTPLSVSKSTKNHWSIDTRTLPPGSPITLEYGLHAHAVSVRENFVDTDVAVINGAPTYLLPVDWRGGAEVLINRPEGWTQTISSLGTEDHLHAESVDELFDSPIIVGSPSTQSFTVEGVEHVLVSFPNEPAWDGEKAAAALKVLATEQHHFWGQFPYPRYLYLNWLGEAGGGLEHKNSTLMITSRHATSDEDSFKGWLGLAAHEQFHAWNVKRLRPRSLGPFDYENEVYTESLWIAEGFTSYYDDLLLLRAGLISEDDWLERMGKNLSRLQNTPGRLEQSVSEASFDAWIKHYRRDENTINSAVSYYTKGAVVAFLLDAKLRALSHNKRSLDDVMRRAYSRYSGDTGYTPDDFVAVIDEVAQQPLGELLDEWTRGKEALPIDDALRFFGFTKVYSDDKPNPWLGLSMRGSQVTEVRRDGPGWSAGINVGDELLAVGSERVNSEALLAKRLHIGEKTELLISRRNKLRTLSITPSAAPRSVELRIDDEAPRAAKRARTAWRSPR